MKKSTKFYLKSLTLVTTILSVPSFAIMSYTVKSGDSLWRIASKYNIAGESHKDIISAIKGINAKENSSINDNIINLNQKLLIPSTKAELEHSLKLYNLRHTQYLTRTEPTLAKVGATPKVKLVIKSQENNVSSKTANPTTIKLIKDTVESIDNTVNFNQKNIVSSAVIPTSNSNNQSQTILPKTTITTEAISDSSRTWYIIIIISIIALLIFRRRYKRKLSMLIDDKSHLKEQFYVKQAEIEVNIETTIKPSSHKKNKDELGILLKKADELIEIHDIAQAKAILQEALNGDAKNLNIRLKILTVYGADGDEISFNSERDYLASNLLSYDDNRWQEINSLYNKYFGIN